MGKIILILVGFVAVSCENRWHFYSPDKNKCVTFVKDSEHAYRYYVIPGRYNSSNTPESNYLLIKWSEDHNFDVNWSSNKYRFAYPLVVKNMLDTSKVDFSYALRDEEKTTINGESWYRLPEVEGFALPYIFRGTYVERRKQMNDAFNSLR